MHHLYSFVDSAFSVCFGFAEAISHLIVDKRADVLTFHHLLQVAHDVHVEHVDREVVVLAHADG